MNALIAAEILEQVYRYDGEPVYPIHGYYPKEVENSNTDTQYIFEFVPGEDLLYIGFPGTASVRDVITDIRAYKKTIPYGNGKSKIRVHAGFLKAYKSVKGVILMSIYKYHPANIIIFGHSLGAALATLCAVDIQYNTGNAPKVYATGSPRIGNRAFRDSYNKRIPEHFRFVSNFDPVTIMPFINYYHVGIRKWINCWWHDIRNYIKGFEKRINDE